MRLALTMPFFALTLAVPCFAQSDDFNPYQAVVDGMPLEQAEPLIEAAYGPIGERFAGPGEPYDGGPIQAILLKSAGQPFFLFCDERLAGFSGPVTASTAMAVLGPLTSLGSNPIVYAHENGISIEIEDQKLWVNYAGVGTKNSAIVLSYPREILLSFDLAKRCAEVAN